MEFIVPARATTASRSVVSFEETSEELAANMASLGFDLPALVRQKKLALDYVRIERSEIQETGEYNLEGLLCGWPARSTRCARSGWRSIRSRRSSPSA